MNKDLVTLSAAEKTQSNLEQMKHIVISGKIHLFKYSNRLVFGSST